jgi:hypothetical protein
MLVECVDPRYEDPEYEEAIYFMIHQLESLLVLKTQPSCLHLWTLHDVGGGKQCTENAGEIKMQTHQAN